MWFVAAHIGAGNHSVSNSKYYTEALLDACLAASEVFKSEDIYAVTSLIRSLEDNPITNAGYGSNLNEKGNVETDATIVEGRKGWSGTIASVKGVKNPISLASALLLESMKGFLPLNRVRPLFLVGDGARKWAKKYGLKTANTFEQELHISSKSKAKWLKYSKLLRSENRRRKESEFKELQHKESVSIIKEEKKDEKDRHSFDDVVQVLNEKMDTVGGICLGKTGNVVSGLSSGGILLKIPGRVGHAGCPGLGALAETNEDIFNWSYSICSTGCGEDIIRTEIVRKCLEYLKINHNSDIDISLRKAFKVSRRKSNDEENFQCGVLGFRSRTIKEEKTLEQRIEIEYFAAFTTLSMGIGVFFSSSKAPEIHLLRSSSGKLADQDNLIIFTKRILLEE